MLPRRSAEEECKLPCLYATALLVFLAAPARTSFVPAGLRRCPFDRGRGGGWIQPGICRSLGCAFRAVLAILTKACPPSHLGHGVRHKASVGIVGESGENAILAHHQVPFDIVKANVTGVNQTLRVSLLDIVEQFFGVKVGAIGDERIPDV